MLNKAHDVYKNLIGCNNIKYMVLLDLFYMKIYDNYQNYKILYYSDT